MNPASTPTPLGKREIRKQERRAAIVAAARKSFLEDGYAATSMSGLLATLGGSKATLWSYFRSKEELFAAVIEDVTQAFREQLEGELLAGGDLRATIVMFCRSLIDRLTNSDALATWRLVVSESGRSPEVGRIFYERAPHHLEQLLAGYFDRQVAAGRLRDEGTLPMAQLLISMCVAQQTRLLLGVENAASDSVDDTGSNAVGDAVNDRAADTFADYFMRLFSL